MSVASYFGVKWINENWDKHYTLNTWYFGQNEVSEEDLNKDPTIGNTFTINYYANKDDSGAEMFELKVSYYSDINCKKVYSLGVQILNPSELSYKFTEYDRQCVGPISGIGVGDYHYRYKYDLVYNDATVNYFNSYDGVSFLATDSLENREEPYIVKIDGKTYAFDFEKEELLRESHGITSAYHYLTSSFAYFFSNVYKSTTHITDGPGGYNNLTLEIDDVFNFYEYNSLTGKFDIKALNFGYDVAYMGVRVNYYERGAKIHEDSLYKQIGKETAGGVIWGN